MELKLLTLKLCIAALCACSGSGNALPLESVITQGARPIEDPLIAQSRATRAPVARSPAPVETEPLQPKKATPSFTEATRAQPVEQPVEPSVEQSVEPSVEPSIGDEAKKHRLGKLLPSGRILTPDGVLAPFIDGWYCFRTIERRRGGAIERSRSFCFRRPRRCLKERVKERGKRRKHSISLCHERTRAFCFRLRERVTEEVFNRCTETEDECLSQYLEETWYPYLLIKKCEERRD